LKTEEEEPPTSRSPPSLSTSPTSPGSPVLVPSPSQSHLSPAFEHDAEEYPDEHDLDEDDNESSSFEDDGQTASPDLGWAKPRRPRPGLSLTVEENEMVINCFNYFSQRHTKKDACQIVGEVLKVGARKVFELTKERELLVKGGAPADCVPLPRNQKKRGKPRERVLDDTHLLILRTLLSSKFRSTGAFPKVSDVQEYLRTLPAKGLPVPNVPTCQSPGPLECKLKTLKGHLTKLRKEVNEKKGG